MTAPLRIVSWNIDGLAKWLRGATRARAAAQTPAPRLDALHRLLGEPDVLLLQEVRLRPEDVSAVALMEQALPGYRCGYALCRDRINVKFRGGRAYGVTSYVREELEPRWLPAPDWEREGRMLVCELPQLGLAIANVYAVNGTSKPYYDPVTGQPQSDRHTWKRSFQTHMRDAFQTMRAGGRELVLVGDWNVSLTALDVHPRLRTEQPHALARAYFQDAFIAGLDVVDAYRALHDERKFTWFDRVAARRGRLDAARVDYALVSRSLLPRVIDADILQEYALQHGSDHAPLTLSLRI